MKMDDLLDDMIRERFDELETEDRKLEEFMKMWKRLDFARIKIKSQRDLMILMVLTIIVLSMLLSFLVGNSLG